MQRRVVEVLRHADHPHRRSEFGRERPSEGFVGGSPSNASHERFVDDGRLRGVRFEILREPAAGRHLDRENVDNVVVDHHPRHLNRVVEPLGNPAGTLVLVSDRILRNTHLQHVAMLKEGVLELRITWRNG